MGIVVKFLAITVALSCCVLAQAASDDYFACVSTKGPDCYFDGTPVADGEVYALVYTKKGATFAGFQADGSLVDANSSDIVMLLPQAENGHCKKTLCVVPKTYATATRLKGLWELFLLDTRKADGTPAGLDENGALSRIRSWGRTDATIALGSDYYAPQGGAEEAAPLSTGLGYAVFASELSVLPADVVAPLITDIRVADGRVTLKVANTEPYLAYDVAGSEKLGEQSESVALEKKDGVAGDEEMVIEADGERAKFFRVTVDR